MDVVSLFFQPYVLLVQCWINLFTEIFYFSRTTKDNLERQWASLHVDLLLIFFLHTTSWSGLPTDTQYAILAVLKMFD